MRKVTLFDRLRYEFDNTMSRGPIMLMGWLALGTVLLVAVATVVALALHATSDQMGPTAVFWNVLFQTLTPNPVDPANPTQFLLIMLFVTIASLLVVSILIGILSTTIQGKLEELRKGRSLVVERNHTIILGWSPQVIPIIAELVIANGSQKRACIVVLAEKDKVEMEDEIRAKVGATGSTRIVCRTGSPIDHTDLEIVNPQAARSIIILAPDSDNPDATVIKVLLALTNNPRRRQEPYHIVAEIHNSKNADVARMVGRDEVVLVQANELIPRITAQTCRQSGLSVVYTQLLDYAGDEIYMKEEPALVRSTFAEALFAYEDSAVMGLLRRDNSIQLLPPMDTVLEPWEKVIAISEDDGTIRLSGVKDYHIDEHAIVTAQERAKKPERTLILGWNKRAPTIVRELDSYLAPGSKITLVAAADGMAETIQRECGVLAHAACEFRNEETTDRRTLDALTIPSYNHVIVLSYSDALDAQEADARTIVTLLHLRDIADKSGQSFSIVSEMMDVRNRELAEVTRADDFVVSNRLVSLMIAQLAENQQLARVFEDLFDPEGIEIYLKAADDYVVIGIPVNFYTVLESAKRRGEIALGYRLHAQGGDATLSYGVHLNPTKSEMVTLAAQDRVIVLAES